MKKVMRTALIHDLILGTDGAQKTLESIYHVYPGTIYTILVNHNKLEQSTIKNSEIRTSFIQRLPFSKKNYRSYLPLYPLAIEQFEMDDYDVILSTSFAVAKGVITNQDQLHICYLHTPIRTAWETKHTFLHHFKIWGIKKIIAQLTFHYLRIWDMTSSNRVDHFIANSIYTKNRIKKLYGRDSQVIYPPVDVNLFTCGEVKEDYFITVSRLVYTKRVDLIIKAFCNTQKKLFVIGDGPEMKQLKKIATPNIVFLGFLPDMQLVQYLQQAKAFISACLDDFGITLVEAMACGTPIIGYNKGGTREIITPEITGLLFDEQSVESLINCIKQFETKQKNFAPQTISKYAAKFSKERFENEIREFVEQKKQFFLNPPLLSYL